MPDIQTVEDLESEVTSVPFEDLMVRYRDCVKGGHVWRPLADNPHGPSEAEYCGWCLRVRIGGFEGWLADPESP